mmetsp:Transcript_49475/g.115717  ORF Transcript_49475/g.115717 Transcript_49475/m.115717 type:complete len:672 (-) Transcript_49475:108-2123(-)
MKSRGRVQHQRPDLHVVTKLSVTSPSAGSRLTPRTYAAQPMTPGRSPFNASTELKSPSVYHSMPSTPVPMTPRSIGGATAATSPFSGTVTLPVGSHSPTASFNSATASLRSFSSADLQFGRTASDGSAVNWIATQQQLDQAFAMTFVKTVLSKRDALKRNVVEAFRQAASEAPHAGASGELNKAALPVFIKHFASKTSLPTSVLADLENSFPYFDFTGMGKLNLNEVYKMVKHHLMVWYNQQLGGTSCISMRWQAMSSSGYTVTRELGKGSQAKALLATDSRGREVCVKRYAKEKMEGMALDDLKSEYSKMLELEGSPYIAKCFDIFHDQSFCYIVVEAYHGGDLTTLKARAASQGVPMVQDWWKRLFKQGYTALNWMHSQALMHCDVKEPNVMLRTASYLAPELVLIDFGVSRSMVNPSPKMVGTPGFIPPETYASKGQWSPRGDVFSMGVTLFQVIIDKVAPTGSRKKSTPGGIFIEGCTTMKQIVEATKIRTPPYQLLPQELSSGIPFLQRLLAKEMSERPSAQQAVADDWLARIPVRGGDVDADHISGSSGHFRRIGSDGITANFLDALEEDSEGSSGEWVSEGYSSETPPTRRTPFALQAQRQRLGGSEALYPHRAPHVLSKPVEPVRSQRQSPRKSVLRRTLSAPTTRVVHQLLRAPTAAPAVIA